MISFKQFITEARAAPLYHGTTLNNLAEILRKGVIKTGYPDKELHWPSKNGAIVSLTRSYNFAKNWAQDMSIKDYWCVIELDKTKLQHNYKVVPFNFFGHEDADSNPKTRWSASKSNTGEVDRNQYEEAVTTDIKYPLRYITAVYMSEGGMSIMKSKFGSEYSLLVRHEKLKIK